MGLAGAAQYCLRQAQAAGRGAQAHILKSPSGDEMLEWRLQTATTDGCNRAAFDKLRQSEGRRLQTATTDGLLHYNCPKACATSIVGIATITCVYSGRCAWAVGCGATERPAKKPGISTYLIDTTVLPSTGSVSGYGRSQGTAPTQIALGGLSWTDRTAVANRRYGWG